MATNFDNPWHTEGYRKLAEAFVYLVTRSNFITPKDRNDAVDILRDAGKQIRKEYDETLR